MTSTIRSGIQSLQGGGRPLSGSERSFFEPRFGTDFSGVRVHSDSRAANVARSVNARAFTLGHDVVFGAGEYSPDALPGRKLLAHELTHVLHQGSVSETIPQLRGSGTVLQRKNGGTSPAKKAYPYSVTTTGCNKAPYTKTRVEAAAKRAFEKVKNSDCIKTESLKESILAEFNGLNINCKQGKDKPCGWAQYYFSQSIDIYPPSLKKSKCGSLKTTILHEVIHLTQWALWHHDLPAACEKSCFNYGSGDASKCTFEKSWVPVFGASTGLATSSDWYARFYFGLEKRGKVLGIVNPSLGIGVGLYGEPLAGRADTPAIGRSTLISALLGLRFDPGKPGGGYISLHGGPALAIGSGKKALGAEGWVSAGVRWKWLDVSVDAGSSYNPTRNAGMEKDYTLGLSMKFAPSLPF